MPSPYGSVPHLLARYRTRLHTLTEGELDAVLDTARGVGLDLRVDDPSKLVDVVDPILTLLHAGDQPGLQELDRHDLAELLALSGELECGASLILKVRRIAFFEPRPVPYEGSDQHLEDTSLALWCLTRHRLAHGTDPETIHREAVAELRSLVARWGLDPVRSETFLALAGRNWEAAIAGRPWVRPIQSASLPGPPAFGIGLPTGPGPGPTTGMATKTKGATA